jgi:small multidrug resistance pump
LGLDTSAAVRFRATFHSDSEVSAVAAAFLTVAIICEVVGTTFLKYSDGFSRLGPSLGTVVGYGLSFVLLAQALKTMEVSIVYAIWSGVGTALITVIGITVLGESINLIKIGGIALIIVGVVALNLTGAQ